MLTQTLSAKFRSYLLNEQKYMKPLRGYDSSKTLIDSNLVDEIFYTIPEILQHHENFLTALQDRLSSDWDSSQVIGNLFIEAVSISNRNSALSLSSVAPI